MTTRRRTPWDGTVVPIRRDGKLIAWQARVPYKDALDHTSYRHKNQRTRREAERMRAQLVWERDQAGGTLGDRRVTVAQDAHHWLHHVKQSKMKATGWRSYEQKLRLYVLDPKIGLGHLALADLRRRHVETWQAKLLERGLSHASINSVSDLLVHMLDRHVGDLWQTNPARIERLPAQARPRTALTPEQVAAVITAYDHAWFQRLVTVLFWTGLRSGELAALRLPDLHENDPDVPHLRVTGTRYQLGADRGVHAPKTQAGYRIVPLLPPARAALAAQRQDHIAMLHAFGTSWNPEQYVFVTARTQRPYSHSQIYMAWRAALHGAGLPPLPLHTTRHTTATLLLAAQVPLRLQLAILGHVNDVTTHGYQHPDLAMLGAAMDQVAEYLETRKPMIVPRDGDSEGDTDD